MNLFDDNILTRRSSALGMRLMHGGIVELKELDKPHTMEEWDAIDALRPWWKRTLEDVALTVEAKADAVRYDLRMRWQKLTTGTNTLEWSNIDTWLPQALALRLRVMAANTQSYPPGWAYENWVAHLNVLAENLEAYDFGGDAGDLERAKNSLRWVTENLEMMWS